MTFVDVLQFLIEDYHLLHNLLSIDVVKLSQINKATYDMTCKWLTNHVIDLLQTKKGWGTCQRSSWTLCHEHTPYVLWHIDNGRCIFCHKPWYRYRRSLYQLPVYAHDLCVRKRLVQDAQGDIRIPVHLSLFEKSFQDFRLKE